MKYFVIIFITLFCLNGFAQKTKNYKKNPYWIEMIKDPGVNYFEAVNAYETFWKGKRKPIEEDEAIGQKKGGVGKEDEQQNKKKLRETRREKKLYKQFGLDCKKFEHWKLQVKPYVQPDGHILSKEEQLKLWEDKKNEK